MNHGEARLFSLTRRLQYGIDILTVGLTAVIKWVLDPFLGRELPFFFFVFPLVLTCWLGGLWPGLLATGLSLVLGECFIIQPGGSVFFHDTPAGLLQAVSFGLAGIAFSVVFDWNRRVVKAEWLERKKATDKVEFFTYLNKPFFPLPYPAQIIAVL